MRRKRSPNSRKQLEEELRPLQTQITSLQADKGKLEEKLKKAREEKIDWQNMASRLQGELDTVIPQLKKERQVRRDAENKLIEMLKDQQKTVEEMQELRDSNAKLSGSVQSLDKLQAEFEAKKQKLELMEHHITGLEQTVGKLRSSDKELATAKENITELKQTVTKLESSEKELAAARAYIKELEEAAEPLAVMLVPEQDTQASTPLVERLRQAPQYLKEYVRVATKVVVTNVLAVIQSRWSIPNLEACTDGIAEDCTEERFEELKEKADPVAESIVQELDM